MCPGALTDTLDDLPRWIVGKPGVQTVGHHGEHLEIGGIQAIEIESLAPPPPFLGCLLGRQNESFEQQPAMIGSAHHERKPSSSPGGAPPVEQFFDGTQITRLDGVTITPL